MVDEQRITALETGSGIAWSDWLTFFEPIRDLPHPELAARALDHIHAEGSPSSPEWWAQGVTVTFEQHIGRRGIGQRCDGIYSATVSKTFPVDMDAALELVIAAGEREEFAGVPAAGEARVSRTEKWRYWRRDLADGSRVSINIQNKPGGKSVVAVNHDDMPTNERITELKTWWKEFLVEVAARP